ncbi:probable serine carboxypeptidase CPVL [Eublepharis macularius]|uniref:Probable serine carboxypeptidase CPVL n=1 Tax=Eublepharis macularius TaxID=481883 RepID=A0AA97K0C4_EUBMA|nr:probable serine carboxypeptidase CPVL [Eublepharis macularius]XP_054847404.1 probable serine carboxypeptidase CPVL [Eublepharis macularius]XP_054847405.1 probable serine carboxypeptidase CPVL [Eublepharis macularius]
MSKITVLLALLSLIFTFERGSSHKQPSVFRSIFKRIKSSVPTRGDPGQPLFLTPYIESGRTEEGRQLSLVGPLPGTNVKSYSGYLTVNKTHNSNLFFWFFPAQKQPENAPVLLWLQGGPGGTSMFGLFVEHGPYVVHKNLTLSERKFPWTSKFSMLYIDNPVGTGFSFTDDTGYAVNQDDVGRDLYSALVQFFQLFPDYQKNDFYATGESYAGKYVPAIGYYIHTHNTAAKIKINFKGVAIGDGLCDPEVMLGGYPQFLYQIGLVDEKQREYVQRQTDLGAIYIQQKKWKEAFEVFDVLLNGDETGSPSYTQNVTGCSNYFNFLQCQEPADQEYFGELLSLPEVRKSIHVGNLTFHDGSLVEKHLLEDVMKTIKPWLAILMDNYRVLLYNGQLDIIVAAPLTERFLPTVPWAKVDEYKNAERVVWKIHPADPDVAGYVRQAGEFYQVIVRGGGHILPYDQPERSLDMIDRFISNKGWKP